MHPSLGGTARLNSHVQAAVIIRTGSQALFILSIEVEAERIQAIRLIANLEKLARI